MKKIFSRSKESNGSKNRFNSFRRGLKFESLEARTLLTAVPNAWNLDQVEGEVGENSTTVVVMNVTDTENEAVLGLHFVAQNGSDLDPGKISIFRYDAKMGTETDVTESVLYLPAETNFSETADSLAFIKVKTGEYRLKLAAEHESTGKFTCSVFVPGDSDGNGRVSDVEGEAIAGRVSAIAIHHRGVYTQATIQFYQSRYGIDITKSAEHLYNINCDMNLDGVLDASDVAMAKINVGRSVGVTLSVTETPDVPEITPVPYSFADPIREDTLDPLSLNILENVSVTCGDSVISEFTVADATSITPALSLTNAKGDVYVTREAILEYWGISETAYDALVSSIASATSVADGTFLFQNASGILDRLAEGETLRLTFTYSIQSFLFEGTTYETDQPGTITFAITGVNNAPSGKTDHTATINLATKKITFEDAKDSLNVLDGVVDPEGDALTVTQGEIDAGSNTVTNESILIDSTGSVTIDLEKLTAELGDLPENEVKSITAYFTINDSHGASLGGQLALTITIVNHAPTGTNTHAGTLDLETGTTTFDSGSTGTLLTGVVDADGDELTVTVKTMTPDDGFTLTEGGIVIDKAGNVTYNAQTLASDFNALKRGETANVVVDYIVSDGNGGTLDGIFTLTITGRNHAPTGNVIHDGTVNLRTDAVMFDGHSTTLNVLDGVTDYDGDTITATEGEMDAGDFTVSAGAILIASTGEVTINVATLKSDFAALSANATANVVVSFTVSDILGGTREGTLTLTIYGNDDAPIGVVDHTGSVDLAGKSILFDSDQTTLNLLNGVTDPDGSALTAKQGQIESGEFTLSENAIVIASNGDVTIDLSKITQDFQSLAANTTATVIVHFTVENGLGVSATAKLTLTVIGQNDGPIETTPLSGTFVLATGVLTFTSGESEPEALSGIVDPDGDSMTISSPTIIPPAGYEVSDDAFSIAPDAKGTPRIFVNKEILADDFDSLPLGNEAAIQIQFDVTDGNGGTLSRTVVLTVIGQNNAVIPPTSLDFSITEAISQSVIYQDIDLTQVLYARQGSADLDATQIYVQNQAGEFLLLTTTNGALAELASGATVGFAANGKLRYSFVTGEISAIAQTGFFTFKAVDSQGTPSENSATGIIRLTIVESLEWKSVIAKQTGYVDETISIKLSDYLSGAFDPHSVNVTFTDLDGNPLNLSNIAILDAWDYNVETESLVFTMLTKENYSETLDFSAVLASITVNAGEGTNNVTSNAFELALSTVKISLVAVTEEFGGVDATELKTGTNRFGTFYYVDADDVPTTDYEAIAAVSDQYYLEIWVQDKAYLYSNTQKFISSIQVQLDYEVDAATVESVQLEDLYAGKSSLDNYLYYDTEQNYLKAIQLCWLYGDSLDWTLMTPITNGENAYLLARLVVTVPSTATSELNVTIEGVMEPESPFQSGYYYVRTGDASALNESLIERVNLTFPSLPQPTNASLPISVTRNDFLANDDSFVSAEIQKADRFFEEAMAVDETPQEDPLLHVLEKTFTVNERRESLDLFFSGDDFDSGLNPFFL